MAFMPRDKEMDPPSLRHMDSSFSLSCGGTETETETERQTETLTLKIYLLGVKTASDPPVVV